MSVYGPDSFKICRNYKVFPMIRLLYIDDNPDTCTIVAAFCERIGTFTVQVLNSGESALEWLSSSTADVIVSDYDIPGGMNGMTLLRELHTRGNTTPFILFTSKDSHELKEEAYRNGAFSVISKATPGKNPIHQLIRTIYWAASRISPE
jgi:DNA-binding NtrC family response regulator